MHFVRFVDLSLLAEGLDLDVYCYFRRRFNVANTYMFVSCPMSANGCEESLKPEDDDDDFRKPRPRYQRTTPYCNAIVILIALYFY